MAWLLKPVGRPPKDLYNFVNRRVKIKPAAPARAKVKIPRGMDKRSKRDILEGQLDDLCRAIYKKRDLHRDGWGYCVSCLRPKIARDLQWGHFIAQAQSLFLRWDPRNWAAQCEKCNLFEQGRQVDFGAELDKHYSCPGFSDGLRLEANRNKTWHPSINDLEEKVKDLRILAETITFNEYKA